MELVIYFFFVKNDFQRFDLVFGEIGVALGELRNIQNKS